MNEKLDRIYNEIEEVREVLQNLKEATTKQPLFSAPDAFEILETLSEFMKTNLDRVIRNVEYAQELIDSLEDEGAA